MEICTGRGNVRRLDHDTIVALHIIGKTQREIAKAVGCKQATVSYVLRRANVSPGSSYIDRDRIKAFHIDGLRPFMIAKRVGCGPDSVSRILEELAVAVEITYQKREARQRTNIRPSGTPALCRTSRPASTPTISPRPTA